MDTQSILIVDDDRLFRKVLKEELSQAGYHVLEAEDGRQALERLQQDDVALAFLDYWLPDTNGVDLLKTIKKTDSDFPIVILTAQPMQEAEKEARKCGVFDYVEKPLNTLELLPIVEFALDRTEETSG